MPPRTRQAARAIAAAQQADIIDWVYKNGRRDQRPRSEDDKFRLAVLAATVADVVTCVGGWLVDRAMLGWDVTVLIAQPAQDLRPLEILGAQPLALEAVLNGRKRLPICDAVSVNADMYFGDARVRRHVLTRLHRRLSEFTLWGADLPTDPSGYTVATATAAPVIIEHRLSLAARAFKAQAVAASLGSPASAVSTTEAFLEGRLRDGFRQSPLRIVAGADSGSDDTAEVS